MDSIYKTLEEARDVAFSDHRSRMRGLRARIGSSRSDHESQHFGTYIYRTEKGYVLSSTFPADLDTGHFVNPDAQGFSGTPATLSKDQLLGTAAITITIRGGWRDAEIRYRVVLQSWAKSLDIPVYVRLINDRYPWYEIMWKHTAKECVEINKRTGDQHQCAVQKDRLGL